MTYEGTSTEAGTIIDEDVVRPVDTTGAGVGRHAAGAVFQPLDIEARTCSFVANSTPYAAGSYVRHIVQGL